MISFEVVRDILEQYYHSDRIDYETMQDLKVSIFNKLE